MLAEHRLKGFQGWMLTSGSAALQPWLWFQALLNPWSSLAHACKHETNTYQASSEHKLGPPSLWVAAVINSGFVQPRTWQIHSSCVLGHIGTAGSQARARRTSGEALLLALPWKLWQVSHCCCLWILATHQPCLQ